MQYYISLLFITLFGCKLNYKNANTDNGHEATILITKKENCIYSERKERAQLLKQQFTEDPNQLNEAIITSYLTDSLISCWYGTQWNFYGTTQIPGNGSIACGYFVTTVLQDAGIKLNRVKLAQCASEEMIKKLTIKSSIFRFRNQSLLAFAETIKQQEKGLYIIGLDFHTGFIYHTGDELYFIHASYAEPKVVRKEKVSESGVLAASKYKIIGKVNFNTN